MWVKGGRTRLPRQTKRAPTARFRWSGPVSAVSMRAPEGIRTPNLLIRSQMLYPLSYGRPPHECGLITIAGPSRRGELGSRHPSTTSPPETPPGPPGPPYPPALPAAQVRLSASISPTPHHCSSAAYQFHGLCIRFRQLPRASAAAPWRAVAPGQHLGAASGAQVGRTGDSDPRRDGAGGESDDDQTSNLVHDFSLNRWEQGPVGPPSMKLRAAAHQPRPSSDGTVCPSGAVASQFRNFRGTTDGGRPRRRSLSRSAPPGTR